VRGDRERIQDILEAIDRIEKYADAGKQRFLQDELVQTWIVHHLRILGESARACSEVLRQTHSSIPWTKIIGMRNILVHHYFGIDTELVWLAVADELPRVKEQMIDILTKLNSVND
jgi:uncharacterized protein with HEPN domain